MARCTILSLKELIGSDKVSAITALSGSGQALASKPIVKAAGIPAVVPIGPLPPLYEPPNDNIFVVGQSYRRHAPARSLSRQDLSG